MRLRSKQNLASRGGVAGAADLVKAGDAGFDGRKRGRSGVRFGLIPVGDGKEIVGANVGVAVLGGSAQGFCERDGRIEMETVAKSRRRGKGI